MVSVSQLMGRSIDPFVIDDRVYWSQPWRLLTCALPHGNPAHLLFNLYWCWTLGALAEHLLGHARAALLVLLAAAGSAAAEYAFAIGGIGLSGVVYGLFGALWMLQRHSPKLRGMIDRPTVSVFIVWFFICIATTKFGWMMVANYAHGAGLVIGVLLGIAFATTGWKRALGWAGGVGLAGLFIACGSLWRSSVNLEWQEVLVRRALPLLEAGNVEQALPLLKEAWERDARDEEMAHDYALTSYQAGRKDEAINVLERWAREHGQGKLLGGLATAMAGQELGMDRWNAAAMAEAAVKLDPDSPDAWEVAGAARWSARDVWGAIDASERALALDPTRDDVRSRLRWMRTDGRTEGSAYLREYESGRPDQ